MSMYQQKKHELNIRDLFIVIFLEEMICYKEKFQYLLRTK